MTDDVTVSANFEHFARTTPDALAVRQGDRTLTYAQALAYAESVARAMLAQGVRHGDRFAVYAHPHTEVLILFLAGSAIGAIFVGLNPRQTEAEIARVLTTSTPKQLFVVGDFDATHAGKVSAVAEAAGIPVISHGGTSLSCATAFDEYVRQHDVDEEIYRAAHALAAPGDPVAMVFTSGSTGVPKGALLTSAPMVRAYRAQGRHWYDAERPPHGVADLPIHHLGFIGDNCMAVIASGGAVSIVEQWTPEAVLDVIEAHHIDFWWTQTTMLLLATQSERWEATDLSSLRAIGFAGAPVSEQMMRKLELLDVQLVTSYGMTEVHGNVTYTDAAADRDTLMTTVGKPDPDFDVRVVDDGGTDVRPGEVGEIVIDSPTLIVGYWAGPGNIKPVRETDGWYHTKDLARVREDGSLELVGRRDHMFKSGGYNVYPREVERVIEELPGVDSAIVVGVTDDRWGHVGQAYVRRRDGRLTEEDVIAHVRERLANYKVPKRVTVCDEFPMLASGKVDRLALSRL